MFAKQHGHLATGTTSSQKEIQIEVTVPPKPEIIQSNRMKSQEDMHNWIQNICSKSEVPAELYKQLPSKNWLRLLVIEPGSATDVLQCQLLQMELELARSRYEALSYCWRKHLDIRDWWIFWKKDASKFEKLICNGFQVQISPNLGEALHHIRHPRLRRVIWVDALCINQNNEEERSQQVSIMDSIYSNALKTLIWVGNDGNAEKGLSRICQIVNSWDPRKPANFSSFDPKTGKTHFRKPTAATLENISENKHMQALHGVFGYDWFHRRWVIQEVVLAKSADLLIGYFTISWAWIGLAAALLRTQYSHLISRSAHPSSMVIRHAMNAYFMFRLSRGCNMPPLEIDLLTLLRLTSSFVTSSPLDTVYALRGLAERVDVLRHLKVNYSLTEEQLLVNVADLLMRSEKAPLDFLSDAGTEPTISTKYRWGGRGKIQARASWIPVWTGKSRSLLDLWAVDERFDAARGLAFQRPVSTSSTHLAVKGILVSTVMWRGDVLVLPVIENGVLSKKLPTSRSILSLIQSGAFVCKEAARSDELISSQALEVFARVLTAGRDPQARRDTSKRANLLSFAAFLSLLLEQDNGVWYDAFSAMAEKTGPDTFSQIAETVTLNRTLFVTTQGHLGLGPVEMRAGNKICVFGGASMPFVLRTFLSDNATDNLYNLIGECYIDGIMDGETVDAMKDGCNHCGPFVPQILLEKLYEYPSLKEEGKEMIRKLLDEALQLGEQAHARLDVSTVELR